MQIACLPARQERRRIWRKDRPFFLQRFLVIIPKRKAPLLLLLFILLQKKGKEKTPIFFFFFGWHLQNKRIIRILYLQEYKNDKNIHFSAFFFSFLSFFFSFAHGDDSPKIRNSPHCPDFTSYKEVFCFFTPPPPFWFILWSQIDSTYYVLILMYF